MQLDLTDEEASALRKLLADAIEYDRFPLSRRIQTLWGILAKFGPMGPPPSPRPPTPNARRGHADRDDLAILSLPNEIPAQSVTTDGTAQPRSCRASSTSPS
jgi:hypothetical protein